jgi:hypothetical protein
MNLDLSVVRDEGELAKLVHEKADTGACGADHFCQRFLADMCRDGLRVTFLSEVCQKKEKAREPLLAGIEQLVDEVFFDAAVTGSTDAP